MGEMIAENLMKGIEEMLEGWDFVGGRPRSKVASENAVPNSANPDQQNNASEIHAAPGVA